MTDRCPAPARPRAASVPVLLAPAGSPEAVAAALGAGADAVYVGLAGFSRGGSRGELDWDQLEVAQRRVVAAGRRLHLALNTIPGPRERALLLERIPLALATGIRDLIVNDVGILAILRQRFPGARLTASVGCGARTVADVAALRDLGADAVVLPGTLDPAEVRRIRTVRGISLEIMIHMVAEYVLLGRCWMPSYLHLKPSAPSGAAGAAPEKTLGRRIGSMKRGGVGVCARICQRPWEILEAGRRLAERQLPSRQISRIAEARAYADAGADALKLQGRSLPAEAVASLVRRYREAIDGPIAEEALPPRLPPSWTTVGR